MLRFSCSEWPFVATNPPQSVLCKDASGDEILDAREVLWTAGRIQSGNAGCLSVMQD